MNEERFNLYKIGIPVIDKEHWSIFEKINDIKHQLSHGEISEARINLAILYEMMVNHIAHEEELMHKCGFPYEKFHKDHHPEILRKIKAIIDAPDYVLTAQYTLFGLRDHIVTHIDHFDSQFKEFFDKCDHTKRI